MVNLDQDVPNPAANHVIPDEALGHSGKARQCACYVLAVLQAKTDCHCEPAIKFVSRSSGCQAVLLQASSLPALSRKAGSSYKRGQLLSKCTQLTGRCRTCWKRCNATTSSLPHSTLPFRVLAECTFSINQQQLLMELLACKSCLSGPQRLISHCLTWCDHVQDSHVVTA